MLVGNAGKRLKLLTVDQVTDVIDVAVGLGRFQIAFACQFEFARQIASDGIGLAQALTVHLEDWHLQERHF